MYSSPQCKVVVVVSVPAPNKSRVQMHKLLRLKPESSSSFYQSDKSQKWETCFIKKCKWTRTHFENTYLPHFYKKSINVVSWWWWVEVFSVFFDLDFYKVNYLLGYSEYFLVRSRQPPHQPGQCVVNLQNRKTANKASDTLETVSFQRYYITWCPCSSLINYPWQPTRSKQNNQYVTVK